MTWLSPRHRVPIWRYETLTSTIDLARELAADVGPSGLLIVADRQTAGRGTRGRNWQSPPGSLAATFIGLAQPRPELGILVGLATTDVVADTMELLESPIRPRLRWPNDVVFAGESHKVAKVGGCLVEALSTPAGPRVIASAGLNLNNDPESLGPNLRTPGASIRQQSGRPASPDEVAGRLADSLKEALASRLEGGFLNRAESLLAGLGEEVTVRGTDGLVRGTVLGLASDGGLRLAQDGGEVIVRFSAEIIDEAAAHGDHGG